MLGDGKLLFKGAFEDFFVSVRRSAQTLTAEQQKIARRALSELRFGVEIRDPHSLATAQGLLDVLYGRGSGALRRLGTSWEDGAFHAHLLRQLGDAFASERLLVEVRTVAPLSEERDVVAPELPPLPRPPRQTNDHSFELRLVDEVGLGVSGVDVEFLADGPRTVTTNAAGVALLSGVQTSSASASLLDAAALGQLLDKRWEKPRPGRPPREANLREVVFLGGTLGPFPLKAAVPNTVVLKPPLRKLAVELFDKYGRARHAGRAFVIRGPQSFQGRTNDQGRLLVENVFPGDYSLTLTLQHFNGEADLVVESVESPLVVLDPGASAPQVRLIGAVPRSVLARLQLFFNTNKTFLLPTALPSVVALRRIYADNAPCKLLVVGHADTRGGAAFNDTLSLERAEATLAYLKDDHDAWLGFYQQTDKKKRWGKVEDRLMILAMPDFVSKPRGEDAVRWYQRTRGLIVDGDAGTQTRTALIKEYMSLDGASLSDSVSPIEAIAHGCGEHFPLDESAEKLDSAPPDQKRDPIDRRVELFFFDPEFGITPPPPGKSSRAGSVEYPKWRERVVEEVELAAGELPGPKVLFIELADVHFRTNSAVVLPEGERPSQDPGQHESLSSINAFALLLRLNEERPGKKLFVAGHTDASGTESFNQPLSQERAECALALLTGDRARFQGLCQARHTVADYKQILAWVARAFAEVAFDCDPGTIDDTAATAVGPVKRFQAAYNERREAMGISQPALVVDGSVGKQTWGAFFDCYEVALRQELGEEPAGVAALREALVFVDDQRKALGFSEHFPIEELGVEHFRSQANRRVELLTFDPGEEPDLVHAQDDPETSELFLPGHYQRQPLPIRPGGAKPHMALSLLLFRPDGARSGVAYELFNEDGSFRQRLSEPQASSELDETLQLDFTDVPMSSLLTLRQVSGAGTLDFMVKTPPASTLTSAPISVFIKELQPLAELTLSFLTYDLEGALS